MAANPFDDPAGPNPFDDAPSVSRSANPFDDPLPEGIWDMPNLDRVPADYRPMAKFGYDQSRMVEQAAVQPDPMQQAQDMTDQENKRFAHFRDSPAQAKQFKEDLDTFTGRFGRALVQGLGAPGSETIGGLLTDPKGYVSTAIALKDVTEARNKLKDQQLDSTELKRRQEMYDKYINYLQEGMKSIPQEYITDLQQQYAARARDLMNQPELSNKDSLLTNIKREEADLFGGMMGGLTDPRNYLIPGGQGKTLIGTMARGAIANAPLAYLTQLEDQTAQVGLGLRDKEDYGEAALGAIPGTVLGASIHTAAHIRDATIRGSTERAKAAAEAMFAAKQAQEAGRPTPGVDSHYPTIDEQYRVPGSDGLADSQAAATQAIDAHQPLVQPGTPEGWNPFDGPLPKERFSDSFPSREIDPTKTGKRAYPRIDKQFRVPPPDEPPPGGGSGYPELGPGFGPDKDTSGFNAPQYGIHDPLREQMGENGEPAHGKMIFPNDTGPFRTEHGGRTEEPVGTDFYRRTDAANQLGAARTLGDAVDVVKDHGTPEEKAFAQHLLDQGMDRSVPFAFDFKSDNKGYLDQRDDGHRNVAVNPLKAGDSAGVILHEATHERVNDAILSVEAGRGNLRQKQYYNKMVDLMNRVIDHLEANPKTQVNGHWFKDLMEFQAYGFTHPDFKALLQRIPMEKDNAWTRFKNTVKDFLGLKRNNSTVFDKMMEASKDWPHIQSSAAERGRAVGSMLDSIAKAKSDRRLSADAASELGKNKYETWERMRDEFIGRPGDIMHFGGRPFKIEHAYVAPDGGIDIHGSVYLNDRWHPVRGASASFIDEINRNFDGPVTIDALTQKAVDRMQASIPHYEASDFDGNVSKIYKNDRDVRLRDDGSPILSRGPGRSQSGSFNPSAFIDGLKWFIGKSDKAKEYYALKLAAHFGPLRNPDEMREFVYGVSKEDMDSGKYRDLPGFGAKGEDGSRVKKSGVFIPQNQLAMIMEKNPIVSSVFNWLAKTAEKAQIRMQMYDHLMEPTMKWFDKNIKDGVAFFREWERLNVVPELRQIREQLEAGGDRAIKDWFTSQGVKPEAVDKMLPYMKVLQHIEKVDAENLLKHGNGRVLNHEPLYWTLQRSGPYHFMLLDENGKIQYARGYDTLGEARRELKVFRDKLPSGWSDTDVIRTDPTRAINSAMTEALLSAAPPWLRDLAVEQYGRRMQYERNFELSRASDRKIGGYIGEVAPTTDGEFRQAAQQYQKAFAHRMRESHHLENATGAVEVAKNILMDENSPLRANMPNTYAWAHSELARHVGVDISMVKHLTDKWFQGVAEIGGKFATQLDSLWGGYKPGKNDNVLGPQAARKFFQASNFFSSMMKIGLNTQVIAGNFAAIGTLQMDGVRNAVRSGVSPLHALEAQTKALAYMINSKAYPEVEKFMQQAYLEGMVEPHGREDYSIIETQDRARELHGFSKAVQYPRDIVEKATNKSALVFYKFFVDAAFPELDGEAAKRTIYGMMKSFTGDYSQHANVLAFSKMGTAGNLFSTFAKWKNNYIGRYVDDIAMLAKIPSVGPAAVLPLIATMIMTAVQAGALGMPILVDYEAIRKFGQFTGKWDLKPASAILSETFPGMEETWLKRGFVTGIGDAIAQKFGQETGPDISTSLRAASPLEVSTVTPGTFVDAFEAASVGLKGLISRQDVQNFMEKIPGFKAQWKSIVDLHGKGITSDDTKQLLGTVPAVVRGPLTAGLAKEQVNKDGTVSYMVPEYGKDEGLYRRNQFQQSLYAATGLRTTDEVRNSDFRMDSEYMKRQKAAQFKALKEGLENNYQDPDRVSRNAIDILKNHGEQSLDEVEKDLQNKLALKTQLDYAGNEMIKAASIRDATALKIAIDRIQSAKKLWKPDGVSK